MVAAGAVGAVRPTAYWNLFAFSLVTISVPVSTRGGMVLPWTASRVVSMPRDPILAGTARPKPAWVPARMALTSPGRGVEADDRDHAWGDLRVGDGLLRAEDGRPAGAVDARDVGIGGQDVGGRVEPLGLVAVGRRLSRRRWRLCRACRASPSPDRRATGCRGRPCRTPIFPPGLRLAASQVPASLPPCRLSVATTGDLPFQSGMSLSIRTTLIPASTAFCSSVWRFGLVGVMAIPFTPCDIIDSMAAICPHRRSRSCPGRRGLRPRGGPWPRPSRIRP